MSTTTSTSRARWAAAVAALLLAPALLTACSSGQDAADPTPKAQAGSSSFFSCMRDKGYDIPDPEAGQKGVSLEIPDGADPDQYAADMQSCAKSAGGGSGAGAATGAKPFAGAEKQHEQLVECVREHGFEDFPDDPDAAGSYKPADQAAYDDALSTCSDEAFADESGTTSK